MSFILFFVAGLGFGYAAVGKWKFLPLLFPLLLAIGAFLSSGVAGASVLKLLIALVLTLIGVFAGGFLEGRAERGGGATRTT